MEGARCEDGPVQCSMNYNITDYLLCARSIPHLPETASSWENQKCLQILPNSPLSDGPISSPVETHSFRVDRMTSYQVRLLFLETCLVKVKIYEPRKGVGLEKGHRYAFALNLLPKA